MNTHRYSPERIAREELTFSIPLYQRLFTWEDSQVEGLLSDLKRHFETNQDKSPYYIGMLSCIGDKMLWPYWWATTVYSDNTDRYCPQEICWGLGGIPQRRRTTKLHRTFARQGVSSLQDKRRKATNYQQEDGGSNTLYHQVYGMSW